LTDALLQELRGETLWLTLNRPNELNAMNKPLVSALSDTFEALKRRHDVRVVVLQAKEELFCAGLDLQSEAGGEDASPARSARYAT